MTLCNALLHLICMGVCICMYSTLYTCMYICNHVYTSISLCAGYTAVPEEERCSAEEPCSQGAPATGRGQQSETLRLLFFLSLLILFLSKVDISLCPPPPPPPPPPLPPSPPSPPSPCLPLHPCLLHSFLFHVHCSYQKHCCTTTGLPCQPMAGLSRCSWSPSLDSVSSVEVHGKYIHHVKVVVFV